jgi:predicted nuclease of predicted toxin-antitoxin system
VLKLLSDENFDGDILRGLFRRRSDLDIVRVQDVGLSATPDPDVLAWAAAEGRILLTHDRDTMPNFAYGRVRIGQPMPGLFLVSDQMPVGQAIDEILLAVECLTPEECKDFVRLLGRSPLEWLQTESQAASGRSQARRVELNRSPKTPTSQIAHQEMLPCPARSLFAAFRSWSLTHRPWCGYIRESLPSPTRLPRSTFS